MPGEGRLSDCLTKQIQDEENGNTDGRKVSEDCKVELRAFKADRATNINKNIELGKLCHVIVFCQVVCGTHSMNGFLSCRLQGGC